MVEGKESEPQRYRLGGRNISKQVALEVPEGFIYSVDGGNSYIRPDTVHLTSTELENYKEVWVNFAPLEANGKTYQLDFKHYSPELDAVRLGLLGKAETLPEPVSIAEARSFEIGSTDLFGTELVSEKMNIMGFVVQKDDAAPYDGGYYLLPRSQADVQWIMETGFPAKPEKDKLLLYPNPAHKTLRIHSEEKNILEGIQVYSLSGRLLQEQVYQPQAPLDVSELEAGTYLLKIKLQGGQNSVRKFVISR